MNKKTEGRGEIIKKGRGCVTARQTQRGGEDDAEQQMDGWTAALTVPASATSHFPPSVTLLLSPGTKY